MKKLFSLKLNYVPEIFVILLLWGCLVFFFGANVNKGQMDWIFILITNSVVEEFVFRGFILDILKSFMIYPIANIVQSLLFVIIHIPYYISLGMGLSFGSLFVALCSLFIFSLNFLSYMLILGNKI